MVKLVDFPWTDLGNTERLIALYGHELRYCHAWKKWLVWDGTRWNANLPEEPGKRACLTVRAMYAEAGSMELEAAKLENKNEWDMVAQRAEAFSRFARKSEARARILAMVDGTKDHLAINPEDLNRDPDLLNCANGTLHLPTGELRPHRQADFLTWIVPVSYTPDARLPMWDAFLEAAIPDEETRNYAQQVAGYTLSGRKREDVVIICHGPGGTGKSTFIEAMKAALGDYAASADIATFTTEARANSAQPDLARLSGKRLVAVWEAETGGAILKLLKAVSGGDVISTRSLFQETFEFRPSFTLWLRANRRPKLPHDDSGLWRRIKETPFVHQFEAPDQTIRETLTDPTRAGEAVLAWMVKGYQAYQAAGKLVPPEAVVRATDAYRQEMDTFREWLEDCTVAVNGSTPFKNLLSSYRKFAGRQALGRDTFSRRLVEAGFNRRNGTGNVVTFGGVALVDEKEYQHI
jgi:putative DNA primase/helicase